LLRLQNYAKITCKILNKKKQKQLVSVSGVCKEQLKVSVSGVCKEQLKVSVSGVCKEQLKVSVSGVCKEQLKVCTEMVIYLYKRLCIIYYLASLEMCLHVY
jgi:hypothetical protein